jgi:hypothetical protein
VFKSKFVALPPFWRAARTCPPRPFSDLSDMPVVTSALVNLRNDPNPNLNGLLHVPVAAAPPHLICCCRCPAPFTCLNRALLTLTLPSSVGTTNSPYDLPCLLSPSPPCPPCTIPTSNPGPSARLLPLSDNQYGYGCVTLAQQDRIQFCRGYPAHTGNSPPQTPPALPTWSSHKPPIKPKNTQAVAQAQWCHHCNTSCLEHYR